MSVAKPVNIYQTLLDGKHPSLNKAIPTYIIKDSDIAQSDLFTIFDHAKPLGISAGYLPDGKLILLAISDDDNCRVVEFHEATEKDFMRRGKGQKPQQVSAARIEGRNLLQDRILCRNAGELFAFDMGPLAMALYCSVNLRIKNAVDIQSGVPGADRRPLAVIQDVLKDASEGVKKIHEDNVRRLFASSVYNVDDNPRNRMTDLAQRAWVSQFLREFENGEQTFEKVKRIDTMKLPSHRLDVIAKIANDSHRLDSNKPLQTTHRFEQAIDPSTGDFRIDSQDYNNKLRYAPDKQITMKVTGKHGEFTVNGSVAAVSGRGGFISTGPVDRKLTDKVITTVTSFGRDDPTSAEAQRAATVLRILQGTESLLDDSPWTQNIWFPNAEGGPLVWPKEWTLPTPPPKPRNKPQIPASAAMLNPSQQIAVNTMLSEADDHRITIIQGPPGTGKTSVIAAFVHFNVNFHDKKGTWLVAQSNVAVKNIAEKLISTGFTKWKILISKDFHFAWHEHLYNANMQDYIIRSDKFNESSGAAKLKDTYVILCTLSMLSNPKITKFSHHNPVKTLVIDEASQIEIGDYLSIFSKFGSTLRKVCFIGDPKQLPPFGQEDLQNLQSIFEVPHLTKQILFLDTQYRMPPQIGRIISECVYDGKLKSNPFHPITDNITACYFLDVTTGKEQQLSSGSFKNHVECMAVCHLAQKLQNQGKNFKIITPYAGQTTHIEETMRENGLAWEDKCFNVDSFQGNEEDYIIISVTRTRGLGFLNNLRRTNVMLSRCKKGMFIVSSSQFLYGVGQDTLVGDLLHGMEPAKWLTPKDIEQEAF